MMHVNEEEMLEKLRKKLGPFEKKDERSELERLFGKKEETKEDRLRKQLVQPTLRVDDELDIYIEKLTFGGEGIGKWKNATIIVPGTVPGDSVKVRIVKMHKGVFHAEILERITGSADRVSPDCPRFGICGGCNLLNLVYPAQLRAKKIMLEDTLKKIADIDHPIRNIIRSPDTKGYRLRAKLHVDTSHHSLQIGFYAAGTHTVVPIRSCPLLAPVLNQVMEQLYTALPAPGTAPLPTEIHLQCDNESSEATIHFVSNEPLLYLEDMWNNMKKNCLPVTGISVFSGKDTQHIGNPFITHTLRNMSLSVPADGFSQANRFLLNTFLDQILMISTPVAQDNVLDLYCGAGFFSLFLARYVNSIIGVDGHASSIEYARKNGSNFSNCVFFEAGEEHFYSLPEVWNTSFSLVIVDPPRSGLHPDLIQAFQTKKPPRLLYISCHPATLARDLATLVASDYRIRVLQPIDMFPHTHHIETIAFLTHRHTSNQAASVLFPDLR